MLHFALPSKRFARTALLPVRHLCAEHVMMRTTISLRPKGCMFNASTDPQKGEGGTGRLRVGVGLGLGLGGFLAAANYFGIFRGDYTKCQSDPALEYKRMFESGRCDEDAKEAVERIISHMPLFGRLLHVDANATMKDFELAAWGGRVCFIFGPQSLTRFLGKDIHGIASILEVPMNHIERKAAQGRAWKLVIFPSGPDFECVRASWDGVENIIATQFPEVAPKVLAKMPQIRLMNFMDIQQQAGYDMRTAHYEGHKNPNYCRLQRLQRLDGTLVEVRQWLFDELACTEDYTGDGFTRGAQGTPEYMCPNKKLSVIPGFVMIDLKL